MMGQAPGGQNDIMARRIAQKRGESFVTARRDGLK
jgi:hypothetical protein